MWILLNIIRVAAASILQKNSDNHSNNKEENIISK